MAQFTNARPRMEFVEAVKSGFTNYVNFKGRARRSEYWWWTLFSCIVSLLNFIPFVGDILVLVMFLPSLAMSVRRLHDVGRSAWWLVAPLVLPIVGGIILIVGGVIVGGVMGIQGSSTAMSGGGARVGIILICLSCVATLPPLVWAFFDSKPETNKYGPSPKYAEPRPEASEDTLQA